MSTAIEAATSFAHALQPPVNPSSALPYFSADATVFEHAPFPTAQPLADFIGKEFKGKDGVKRYFDLLGHDFEPVKLVIDTWWVEEEEKDGKEVIGAKGEGTWKATKTGKKWTEEVIWRFEMVNTNTRRPDWNIQRWEIFADPEALGKAMDGEIDEAALEHPSTMGRELATKAGMKVPEGKGSGKEQ
ncbi:hypothetical protein BJ508DRAFT_413679 [Ascobolus immersus RN42]|uniref:SnoaL-like domain-containing protein n=1 Tax=Ascobolus immersus RN42 TaxID=1160509 RepID=A0A3N4IFQ9_ASCIM|nr:hypothetical protein BJ508DRAFT_413679 [Ascobolus immersus RN42]